MMEINVHNYEAFLLDEAEGRLDAAQSAALRAFLLAHPHLGAEGGEEPLPVLDPADEHFPFLQSLLKDEPTPSEEQVLSYLEGLLDDDTRTTFEKRLASDPGLRQLTDRYRQIKLAPSGHTMGETQFLRKDLPSAAEELVLRYTEGLMTAQEALQFEKENDAERRRLVSAYSDCRLTPDEQVVFPRKEMLLRSARVVRLQPFRFYGRVAAAVMLLAMLTVLLWPTAGPSPAVVSQAAKAPEKPTTPAVVPAASLPSETQVAEAEAPGKMPRISRPEKREVVAHEVPAPQLAAELPPVTEKQDMPQDKAAEPLKAAEPVTVVSDLGQLAWAEDRQENEGEGRSRKKFWEKTAGVLGQLKKLGVKGVDASEERHGVTLSINALSVEKKYAGL